MTTEYHSKYYAYKLTRRCHSDQLAKLNQSIFNATIDLNPHQIDAALFAFRYPLSRGAILADEVGLGKTIEAGLIISQLWAENKRRSLYEAQDDVDIRKDQLISEIEARFKQKMNLSDVFTLRWRVN